MRHDHETMTWVITCGLTLLHMWLVPSKAMLAPPMNLTVGLLDFVATVKWLPGPGNPPGTRYTLEFITAQNISGGQWNRSPKCSDIAMPKCDLTFDPQSDEVFWNYFVKVKTMFNGTSSIWANMPSSFQPYGDTCLSAPEVKISTDQRIINISFSHKMEFKPGIKPLRFSLYLYENSFTEESKFVAQSSTSKSPHIFRDVPPGRKYCVNVSASYQQALHHSNINTTECFFLSDSPGGLSVRMVWVVLLILLIIFIIAVALTCFYHMRFKMKDLHIPEALLVIPRTKSFLKLSPEKFHTITSTWKTAVLKTEDCISASEEDNTPMLYLQRESFLNVQINSLSLSNQDSSVHLPNNDEGARKLSQYSLFAENSEKCEENIIPDNMHVDDMHPDATVPFCTSTLNLSLFTVSEVPQIHSVNLKMDGNYTEKIEGKMCSELSDSYVEEKDDVSPCTGLSLDYGYEPRCNIGLCDL